MSDSELIIEATKRAQKVGTPVHEHAAKVFAFRDEFIAYVNRTQPNLEWLLKKVDRYSVHGFMDIVKEAEEKGVTFDEIDNLRGDELKQQFEQALKSIVEEFEPNGR